MFIYPFGAIVFRDLRPPLAQRELERLRRARPGLTAATVIEELSVREDPRPDRPTSRTGSSPSTS